MHLDCSQPVGPPSHLTSHCLRVLRSRWCRHIILGVGLSMTVLVVLATPVLLEVWWRRRLQQVTEAETRIAKETFSQTLCIVCHELRNPVHALQGMLSVFLDENNGMLTTGQRYELNSALSSVRTMQSVLDDVMEMQRQDVVSRTARGGFCCAAVTRGTACIVLMIVLELDANCTQSMSAKVLHPRIVPTDLSSVVRDVANRSRNDMKAAVRFRVACSTGLPSESLLLDPTHIRMVSPHGICPSAITSWA